jgi:hypothetical protein
VVSIIALATLAISTFVVYSCFRLRQQHLGAVASANDIVLIRGLSTVSLGAAGGPYGAEWFCRWIGTFSIAKTATVYFAGGSVGSSPALDCLLAAERSDIVSFCATVG